MSELSKTKKELSIAEKAYNNAQAEYVKFQLFGGIGLSDAERIQISQRHKANVAYLCSKVNGLKNQYISLGGTL